MIKKILLSIGIFLIGAAAGIGMYIYDHQSPKENPTTPQPTVQPTPFSVDQAPQQSLRGTISSLSGSVQWQSRIATEPASLASPRSIQQGEKIVTQSTGVVDLHVENDTLHLYPDTELTFEQTLPVNVVYSQPKGKILYTIESIHPVSVRTHRLLSQLEQGQMTLTVDEKTDRITLTVVSGQATIAYNDDQFTSQKKVVKNGERFVFDNENRQEL